MPEKHAVFDYNGTLSVAIDFWGDLDEYFGIKPEESRRQLEKFREGEISGDELDNWRIKRYNQSKKDSSGQGIDNFFEMYYQENGLREDAKALVETLREEGFRIHLLSHAPDGYVQKAAEELDAHVHVETAQIKAEENVQNINWDLYEKANYIESLDGEVWFYGDGKGDFNAAESADRGFLIENIEDADYRSQDAFTGSFEDVKSKTFELLEATK